MEKDHVLIPKIIPYFMRKLLFFHNSKGISRLIRKYFM